MDFLRFSDRRKSTPRASKSLTKFPRRRMVCPVVVIRSGLLEGRTQTMPRSLSAWGWLVALLLVALLGSAVPAHAQSDGVIQGTVQDAQSAVLPGVAMTLRNTDT